MQTYMYSIIYMCAMYTLSLYLYKCAKKNLMDLKVQHSKIFLQPNAE